jgi:hypothetical protein
MSDNAGLGTCIIAAAVLHGCISNDINLTIKEPDTVTKEYCDARVAGTRMREWIDKNNPIKLEIENE